MTMKKAIRRLLVGLGGKLHEATKSPERKELERNRMRMALDKAHKDGFAEAERFWTAKIEREINDLKDEYGIILASKDVQIEQQARTIKSQEEELANARKAYKNYYHASIANKRMIAEISHNVQRLFNMSGDIFKSFITIHDAANEHVRGMLRADAVNRRLLGIVMTPSERDAIASAGFTHSDLDVVEEQIKELNMRLDGAENGEAQDRSEAEKQFGGNENEGTTVCENDSAKADGNPGKYSYVYPGRDGNSA